MKITKRQLKEIVQKLVKNQLKEQNTQENKTRGTISLTDKEFAFLFWLLDKEIDESLLDKDFSQVEWGKEDIFSLWSKVKKLN